MQQTATFRDAFRFWLKLGFISFGGPAGQIAIMQRELVDEKKWIGQDDFLNALNFCMLLPGPEAQQLATYIGWRLHGYRGGLAAGALFVLPSIFVLLVLSWIYAAFGSLPYIDAVLDGFKAVVVAIVVEAVIRISTKSMTGVRNWIIGAAAFALIFAVDVPFPLIVLGAALAGLLLLRQSGATAEVSESAIVRRSNIFKLIPVFAALWLLPLLAIFAFIGTGGRLPEVYLFFSKAALVTFGGAYAVLSYVNQAVVSSGWITRAQSVDGLALAETTPGPLIMVLQFIGFMAGWNASGGDPGYAVMCALATSFVTFLPSFFFIFAGAPYVERFRSNRAIKSALAGVSAAVVGVVLNLAIVFGSAVFVGGNGVEWFSILLGLAAFVALQIFKVDVLAVVLAGGFLGLAKHLIVG